MNGREVIKKLKVNGFKVVRISSSHHILRNDLNRPAITYPVPVHSKKDIPIGTLKSIEKITGIKLK